MGLPPSRVQAVAGPAVVDYFLGLASVPVIDPVCFKARMIFPGAADVHGFLFDVAAGGNGSPR